MQEKVIDDVALDAIYQEMVATLAKKGTTIKAEMTDLQAELAHMAMLITTEAAELADAFKKHIIYQKPLDMVNVKEEMGDIEWTLERIRQLLLITRQETRVGNIEKLGKRYYNGAYSNISAQIRQDKV